MSVTSNLALAPTTRDLVVQQGCACVMFEMKRHGMLQMIEEINGAAQPCATGTSRIRDHFWRALSSLNYS